MSGLNEGSQKVWYTGIFDTKWSSEAQRVHNKGFLLLVVDLATKTCISSNLTTCHAASCISYKFDHQVVPLWIRSSVHHGSIVPLAMFVQDVEIATNATTGRMQKTLTTASGAATMGSVWTMQVWTNIWNLYQASEQVAFLVVPVPHLVHVITAQAEP